ncbi:MULTISPECIES: hypothetical protein [unclassified Acidovorax]|uniref:hypothetical protein n=1 Tax=unclassified Acidovorax TaxID=2684926 RepID=UPI0010DF3BD8|nr:MULTISPECIES: hypothetical protein [unclassified Acidovorax]RYF75951.1 MAG: hypothetical protein EOO29_23275 [Comamonadaceae bacterium]
MRAAHTLLLLALASAPALVLAQNPEQPAAPAGSVQRDVTTDRDQAGNRHNQRVERIVVEDEGSRVDELRVGGQTQSITVQPKGGSMPSYEVQPTDGVRARPGSRNGAETVTAPRVWNLGRF